MKQTIKVQCLFKLVIRNIRREGPTALVRVTKISHVASAWELDCLCTRSNILRALREFYRAREGVYRAFVEEITE